MRIRFLLMIIPWLLCQHIAGQGVGWQLPAEIAGIYGVFEVNDLAPGASGRDCIWDFSGAEALSVNGTHGETCTHEGLSISRQRL